MALKLQLLKWEVEEASYYDADGLLRQAPNSSIPCSSHSYSATINQHPQELLTGHCTLDGLSPTPK